MDSDNYVFFLQKDVVLKNFVLRFSYVFCDNLSYWKFVTYLEFFFFFGGGDAYLDGNLRQCILYSIAYI